MIPGVEAPLVYSPRSLAEALALFVANPQAQIFAGGTSWSADADSSMILLAPVTISLSLAEDMRRIAYGERYIDLGAAISLNQLLAVGGPWIPDLLKRASREIGTSALRNLATLGGNLCQKEIIGDLVPIFHLLGGQLELRSLKGSRWVTLQQVVEEDRVPLTPGEVVSRIRIPQETWDLTFYRKIGSIRTPSDERLSLSALVRTKNGQLEQLRFSFHFPFHGLVRVREIEAELSGQNLPLSSHDRSHALKRLEESLEDLPTTVSTFQRDRMLHMTRWLFTRLDDE